MVVAQEYHQHPYFDLVAHYLSQYPEKAPKAKTIKEANDIIEAMEYFKSFIEKIPEDKIDTKWI